MKLWLPTHQTGKTRLVARELLTQLHAIWSCKGRSDKERLVEFQHISKKKERLLKKNQNRLFADFFMNFLRNKKKTLVNTQQNITKTQRSLKDHIECTYSYIPNKRVVLNNSVGKTIFLKD